MTPTTTHRAVIVGGGLAGLEAALYLRARLGERVAIDLISDEPTFVYRPFLTYVAFGLEPERLRFNLADIANEQNFRFILGRASAVDPQRRLIRVGAQSIAYDSLLLATGAAPVQEPIPGLRRAHTVWDEDGMHDYHFALRRRMEDNATRVVFLVPPEASWSGPVYELAMMTATWLSWKGVRDRFDLRVATAEPSYVAPLGTNVHSQIADGLAVHGIVGSTGLRARRVEASRVEFDEGDPLSFDLLVSAAVYRGVGPTAGLDMDERGFLRTRLDTRQLAAHDHIYAVGDGSDYPLKQGFLALMQADAAAEHVASVVLHSDPMFDFSATVFWLMEEFDQVLFAHAEGDGDAVEVERLPTGRLRRLEAMGYLPKQQRLGNPLYSGLLWKGTEIGLKLIRQLEAGHPT